MAGLRNFLKHATQSIKCVLFITHSTKELICVYSYQDVGGVFLKTYHFTRFDEHDEPFAKVCGRSLSLILCVLNTTFTCIL